MEITNEMLIELNNFRNEIIIIFEDIEEQEEIYDIVNKIKTASLDLLIESMSYQVDNQPTKEQLLYIAGLCFQAYQKDKEIQRAKNE